MKYLTRKQVAKLLGVNVREVSRLEKEGTIPVAVKVQSSRTGRPNFCYKSEFFENFNVDDLEEVVESKGRGGDIYNVRKSKKCFEYSGHAADVILFCQPALRNRGLKFSNET